MHTSSYIISICLKQEHVNKYNPIRILNLQLNRHFPALGKLLHLGEAGLVHLLCLDVVVEELLPLGGHLGVEHIPGGLLHQRPDCSWLDHLAVHTIKG